LAFNPSIVERLVEPPVGLDDLLDQRLDFLRIGDRQPR